MTMINKQQGIMPILIIVAILLGTATVGGGYYVLYKRAQVTKQEAMQDANAATVIKTIKQTTAAPTIKSKPDVKPVTKSKPKQPTIPESVPAPDVQTSQTAGTMSVKVTIDKDGDGVPEHTIYNTDGVLDREEFDAKIQADQ